jgi:hypothetical protein
MNIDQTRVLREPLCDDLFLAQGVTLTLEADVTGSIRVRNRARLVIAPGVTVRGWIYLDDGGDLSNNGLIVGGYRLSFEWNHRPGKTGCVRMDPDVPEPANVKPFIGMS